MRLSRLAVLVLVLNPLLPSPASAGKTPTHREWDCSVRGRTVHLEELRLSPGQELRAIANPSSRPNPECRDGYGGDEITTILKRNPEVLGATNGTFFMESKGRYIPTALLWSKGSGLLGSYSRARGTHIFVADAQGNGHEVTLSTAEQKLKSAEIVQKLTRRYPGMTLVLQSSMALMGGKLERGRFKHGSVCPDPDPKTGAVPGAWRCMPHARTVLCARRGGGLSLITTASAYPAELAEGLRVGGQCRTECENFYNLDGGGSTQMAHRADGAWVVTGREIETSQPGCGDHRPVQNYLVVVGR